MNRRWLLLAPAVLAIVAVAKGGRTVATLAPADEPGTRLIIDGQVFDPAGSRGVAGVTLYAYHTDAKGMYGPVGSVLPRLRGTVVTDGAGRFQWRTIRPMPYPNGRGPAHIHIKASGGGYPEQWVDELWFLDDPNVTEQQKREAGRKGRFSPVVATTRDASGVLHATFNIRLSDNPRR